ncbi:MAG: hypothetical protein D6706_07205 [Chloroflexi bacterium]|nr:MAG: hypothetical protein D6706_07205 [Chloroflexota bacterium]
MTSVVWLRFQRWIDWVLVSVALLIVLSGSQPVLRDERYRLSVLVSSDVFDFVWWEVQALGVKLEALLTGGYLYLDEAQQREIVLQFLSLVGEVRELDAQMAAVFADPETADPDVATADLQAELAEKRAEMATLQPLAEAILQQQVATVLAEEGLAVGGITWPPVMMHMTPLPSILIVSPRERIDRLYGIPLRHGMSVAEKDALETAVLQQLNRAALVVPIGGLGIYPAMVLESSNINWLADTIAHEWAHHWLTLHPVGLYYNQTPEMRTINETTASIVGTEIGRQVIARYYPEHLPAPPAATSPPPTQSPQPSTFDFRAEMAQTRITVDRLLSEGQIVAAEFYMEARRRYFVANGYNIRKLNQAYFAFYGSYADEPGASGSDPVGPAVLQLRAQSPSLKAFLETIATITSFQELQQHLNQPNQP